MLCHRLFSNKGEGERKPLLEQIPALSDQRVLEEKFQGTKNFRRVCKKLRDQLRLVWESLDLDPNVWGTPKKRTFELDCDCLPSPSITSQLAELIHLHKKLSELTLTYKDFVLSMINQLGKNTETNLVRLISEWRSSLWSDLQSLCLGAKELCEPKFYIDRVNEKKSETDHPDPFIKFLEQKSHPKSWGETHSNYRAYSRLSDEDKLLLNKTLFDLSFEVYQLWVGLNISAFRNNLKTEPQKTLQHDAPAVHTMREVEHKEQTPESMELAMR